MTQYEGLEEEFFSYVQYLGLSGKWQGGSRVLGFILKDGYIILTDEGECHWLNDNSGKNVPKRDSLRESWK